MTDTDKTLVTFLLDRTGSMDLVKADTIKAFNAYLKELKKDAKGIEFTLIQFDAISVDKLYVRHPLKKVRKLTDATFVPRDMTPLIDASVKTIKAVEKQVKGEDIKVVICILTDGQENASTEYTWKDLSTLIAKKRKKGWQFNFMGAGIDAYDQGARMGVRRGETVSYDSMSPIGTRSAFVETAANTAQWRRGVRGSTAYTAEQKTSAGDKYDTAAKGQLEETVVAVDDFTL